MDENLDDQIEKLERSLAIFMSTAQDALGATSSIEHKGVTFNVSRRFVIADLSPLAFFHLVEHIEAGGARAAAVRLFDRLAPLLLCRHDWTPLKRASDHQVISLSLQGQEQGKGSQTEQGPHICKRCTAYALGPSLPTVGRG